MPYNKKPAGARPAKKFGPKAGSRSPNHRGYRAEPVTDAPKKKRWNADERAERAGNPTRSNREGGTGGRARSERPNWEPKGDAGSGRNHSGGRVARERSEPAYRGRADRPARSYDDRAPRGDRPVSGGRVASERSEPAYRDRGDRPARSYDDRPKRSHDDRAPRGDRSARSYDDRAPRGDRPARSYDDRPKRSFDDRAPRGDRPARSFGDRPKRTFDDRPRNEHSDSKFYPSREEKGHFTPHDDV
ncbi:MAG TPA: ATP-dependent helicase, partial [Microbacteriaceae bacterium]|nr:ATP-dependent helicase [Microbacteriaceae bacterium]